MLRFFLDGCVTAIAIGVAPAHAHAQEQSHPQDNSGGSLTDDITVVATRNQSSVQNVGISVSASYGFWQVDTNSRSFFRPGWHAENAWPKHQGCSA